MLINDIVVLFAFKCILSTWAIVKKLVKNKNCLFILKNKRYQRKERYTFHGVKTARLGLGKSDLYFRRFKNNSFDCNNKSYSNIDHHSTHHVWYSIKSNTHSTIHSRHNNDSGIIQKNDLLQQSNEWRRSAVGMESIDVQNGTSEYVWQQTKLLITKYLLQP